MQPFLELVPVALVVEEKEHVTDGQIEGQTNGRTLSFPHCVFICKYSSMQKRI